MPITDHDPLPLGPGLFAEAAATHTFGKALRQGLDLPVCALRATLQALCRDFPRDAEAGVLLRGAIEEVGRIEDNVRDLVAFAVLPKVQPLACEAGEVVGAALQRLSGAARSRVRTSVTRADRPLTLDATIASEALRRVIENALEASSEDVLVVARFEPEAETVSFSVVNGCAPAFEADWALAPFRTSKPDHLGLGLTLARRDVELLGGQLRCEGTATGGTRVSLRLPAAREDAAARGEAA